MLVHRATRAVGATGPPRDPARGGGRVRHRGGADHRGAGGQGTYTPGEGRRLCPTPGRADRRGAGGQGTYCYILWVTQHVY